MSKYFGWIDGKPYEFKFKKHPQGKGWYMFYLGEHRICTVVKNKRLCSWSCIVHNVDDCVFVPTLVDGFATRYDAIQYGLKVNTITRKTYNK